MKHAFRLALLPVLAVAAAFMGCNDNELGATKRRPNLPQSRLPPPRLE